MHACGGPSKDLIIDTQHTHTHLHVLHGSLYLLVSDALEADLATERTAGRHLQPARQTGRAEMVAAAVGQLRLTEHARTYRTGERGVRFGHHSAT